MKTEIHNRINQLNASIEAAEQLKAAAITERESYYWKINLCNSSDSFNEFKEENPNHPLLQYCHVQRPVHSGYLSDVIVRILRCDISREDFLSFSRQIVNPRVGETDFDQFEYRYKLKQE